MPGIQGINGIQGIQGLQGMPGVMGMRGMVGMQAMQGPPGMQGVPYDQLERRAGTPDYAQEYGSAGPFVAPVHNMHWGPFGQVGADVRRNIFLLDFAIASAPMLIFSEQERIQELLC